MMLLGIVIFSVSTWAVFSHRFVDGIVTKHFLIFAAITAMLVIVDPHNVEAAVASIVSFAGGVVYWIYKHRNCLRQCWRLIVH